MATKEIKMPHLGESVTEAAIVQWLVKPGDSVKRYDPLMEVVSDKVTTEVPSDFDGVVKEFLISLDTDVPIGTAVMTLETEETTEKTEEATLAPVKEASAEQAQEHETVETTSTATSHQKNNGRYSPAVLKIAQEKKIDLTQVTGTGRDGRITRKDVTNFTPTQARTPEKTVSPGTSPSISEEPVASQNESAATASPTETTTDKIVSADPVRKAIAKKMVQSVNEIPHAWLMVEADVTNLVQLRNSLKDEFKQQEGLSLSFFPFFAKAVIQALKKNPKINTSWDDGSIIYHKDVNLSIAVTTDEHLYVPVIQQADNYSIAGLAKEINRLAQEVRQGTLSSKEMQGGTFTLNNTGTLGSVQSMGIINHPQAAILQIESINKRLVPTADGGFKVADMVNLCLSIDHRILDGQQAGKFLRDVKDNLAKYNADTDVY
ncbi:TPA: 2-oxo acid dehydrogenase subunit E2 [Enterococcus faecalis]|uniref:Dihydrolipoamide acetyltransferase component of pyruvate dehydrogenase complex n=3 Tax=Enterococcus TaxID=1350 RepID=R3I6T8_ENTFL|nr:dihydrolipoamide acetyltransferase family protein [Enterococcus faecalis]EIB6517555.1 2-oxo acid dehydrogenase subunit E2 [Enterococcus faecalis]EOK13398.1 branched-chain alpha-keto acid dehydrogenase, E2 component, dihydrolipoamide acetyltransferase [Enterococcus faecalis ATCC 6055]HBI1661145.1 2-oxo acid dehydrogenase subunit E2 [Enterococcus faecalis]HBI1690045.1 2-oxo acid dehydrogenase subunit E2 [Enterococcus faecalis]HBI1695222.1 2-oxo acid dehydrogenase subunit E2 [Enterococcus faec